MPWLQQYQGSLEKRNKSKRRSKSNKRKPYKSKSRRRKNRSSTRRKKNRSYTLRGGGSAARGLMRAPMGGPAGGWAPGPASRMPRVAGLPTPTGEEAVAMEKRMAKAAEVRQQLEEARKQAVGARDNGPVRPPTRPYQLPDVRMMGAIAESMKTPVPPTNPNIHDILIDLYISKINREYTAREPNSPSPGFLLDEYGRGFAKRMLHQHGVIKKK
jgi:hypothetical protein